IQVIQINIRPVQIGIQIIQVIQINIRPVQIDLQIIQIDPRPIQTTWFNSRSNPPGSSPDLPISHRSGRIGTPVI
ncbi:MAG: hypothetical protein K6B12_02655, partial [Clostridiales bacterium]|nr:hypothetical protein [Clostridiales bacterium]